MAYLTAPVVEALEAWLRMRGDWEGPLLTPVGRGRRALRQRLERRAVNKALHTRGQAVGLAPFTPHDLRRTFISQLLEAGSDLATVQQLAGHTHINTTALYDRRAEKAKRAAMGRLPFPGAGARPPAPDGHGAMSPAEALQILAQLIDAQRTP